MKLLRGQPLVESDLYWRGYGKWVISSWSKHVKILTRIKILPRPKAPKVLNAQPAQWNLNKIEKTFNGCSEYILFEILD